MAYLLKVNGDIEHVGAESGSVFTLEELQKLVGGYITVLIRNRPAKTDLEDRVNREYRMVVDEDGLSNDRPKNFRASFWFGDDIVGDALIVEMNEIDD
jgi:hypothetical protein